MEIEIITNSRESIEEREGDSLMVRIDGQQYLYVYDDLEEPENNRMNGSFASIYQIRALIEKVYQMGLDREPLLIKHIEI